MGWVLLILLIIFLILVFSALLSFILPIVAISLPACGAGLIVGFSVFFAFRHYLVQSLHSPTKLAKLVRLSFDGNELNCTVDESKIATFANVEADVSLAVLSCVGTTLAILLYFLVGTDAFQGHVFTMNQEILPGLWFSVSDSTAFVLSCLIPIAPIAYAFTKLKPKQSFNRSIREEVDRLVAEAKLSLKATKEVRSLLSHIASLSAKIKIQFPENMLASIRSYIDSHQAELLISTAGLDRLLEAELAKVKDDRNRLERAVNLYETAMSLYTDTSRQVNKAGSIPLIKELEYDYEGLISPNLKSLLPSRKWSDFHDVLNSIIGDLQRLNELAIRYQSHEEESEEEDYAKAESSSTESSKQKAYRILGVPATASIDQIKRVYKKLVEIYHPDKKMIDDDARIKEITWAYDFVRSIKKNVG